MIPGGEATPLFARGGLALARAARRASGARGAALVFFGAQAFVDLAGGDQRVLPGPPPPPGARDLPLGALTPLRAHLLEPWRALLSHCFPFPHEPAAVLPVGGPNGPGLVLLLGALPPGGEASDPATLLSLAEAARDCQEDLAALAELAGTALLHARSCATLWQEARRDALTRLHSHRRFLELAAEELERAAAAGLPLSLLMVDLDNFRTVNEACGYEVGDRVLQEFARFLETCFSEGEPLARYAGNQFAALLPGVGPGAALARAQELRERIAAYRFRTLEAKGCSHAGLTASIGVASFPSDARSVAELVEASDRALLEAQRRGGDQVQAFPQVRALAGEARWYSLLRSKLPGRSSEVYVSTIRTLLAALEAKDRYTNSHSQGVAYWSERIARRLALPEDQVATVALGGLLHDIGKIGIAEAILRKKGPLTAAEYTQIKEHPALGEAILCNVAVAEDVVEIVLHHQERFDGRGYPAGLAGEAIPLGARVVAVADAFHSITSRRPYRPARSEEEALAEIKRWAGIMFDPRVVAAFEAVLRAGNGKAPTDPGRDR